MDVVLELSLLVAGISIVLPNSRHLSVNARVSRDDRTRGMLEDVVATRRTNGQTGVFVSMFICPTVYMWWRLSTRECT